VIRRWQKSCSCYPVLKHQRAHTAGRCRIPPRPYLSGRQNPAVSCPSARAGVCERRRAGRTDLEQSTGSNAKLWRWQNSESLPPTRALCGPRPDLYRIGIGPCPQLAQRVRRSGAGNGNILARAVLGESIAGHILPLPYLARSQHCSCAACCAVWFIQLRSLQRARNPRSRRAQHRAGAAGEVGARRTVASLDSLHSLPSGNARRCPRTAR